MSESSRVARKLAALVDLGLERADVAPITTRTSRIDWRTQKIVSSRPAMGTLVSVVALGSSRDRLEEAVGRAFDEMDRLIAIFSRYEGASAIARLNDAGGLSGAPPELSHVVGESLRLHELSRGSFDPSVAPLVDLFSERLDAPAPRQPTEAEIREALELVGARHITVTERRITFARSGMAITLDAIAKGYIVDAMAQVLEQLGVKRYLVDGGGDIRTRGTKEHRQAWTVAVEDPRRAGNFPDTIRLTDGAVATSGSYERYFGATRRFHHIVSAETGRSPDASVSVTVVAPTTMAADALATAVFVMAPRDGVAFIDGLHGCECLIIGQDGSQLRSRGWKGAGPTDGEGAVS